MIFYLGVISRGCTDGVCNKEGGEHARREHDLVVELGKGAVRRLFDQLLRPALQPSLLGFNLRRGNIDKMKMIIGKIMLTAAPKKRTYRGGEQASGRG